MIQESVAKCGLDLYWLPSRKYDPMSADKGSAVLERMLVIATGESRALTRRSPRYARL